MMPRAADRDRARAACRAQERRQGITDVLQLLEAARYTRAKQGLAERMLDLTPAEGKGQYLEGTGGHDPLWADPGKGPSRGVCRCSCCTCGRRACSLRSQAHCCQRISKLLARSCTVLQSVALADVCACAGAFVLDRVRGIAYLNISERADVGLAEQWVHDLGYKVRACQAMAETRPAESDPRVA